MTTQISTFSPVTADQAYKLGWQAFERAAIRGVSLRDLGMNPSKANADAYLKGYDDAALDYMNAFKPDPSAVLEAAKVRARQSIIFRSIIPLPEGRMLKVYDTGNGVFLYGFTVDGELTYTTDEEQALDLVQQAVQA